MKITYLNHKLDKNYRKESAEAADWLLHLKSGDMSSEKRTEFENWLSEILVGVEVASILYLPVLKARACAYT